MSGASSIEWTDATWNPVTGCTKVSAGCDNCYAERITTRFHGPGSFETVVLHPDRLDRPLHWRAPRRVFVNSMSDLFHASVPWGHIARVWDVMEEASQHTFQVLTKRAERMERALAVNGTGYNFLGRPAARPLPNVWLGVSVESPTYYSRIRHLHATAAAVRFLSLEPLLAPLPDLPLGGIHWVIVGGESGPGARPMHPLWVRDIRDQCKRAGVAFFFKQWGAWRPVGPVYSDDLPVHTDAEGCDLREIDHQELLDEILEVEDGRHALVTLEHSGYAQDTRHEQHQPAPGSWWMERVGKGSAGRELDGATWDRMPAR